MENTKADIKKILESKVAVKIFYILGIIIVAMLIFYAGMIVGFRKASFGSVWGEHYNENFGMGHRDIGPIGNIMNRAGIIDDFPNAHGATGKIIKIESPNIIVQDDDNVEKMIATDTNTQIQEGRADITTADLKLDDFIITIGEPNDKGIIDAKFIRVIPAPEFLK